MLLRQEHWCVTDACAVSCGATLENVRLLADALRDWTAANGLTDVVGADLELAIVEAANNIVLHGTQGMKDQSIGLTIRRVADGVEVTLEDNGRSIPAGVLEAAIPLDLGAESGRGMGLIAACTDRVDYFARPEGNRLVLFKAVPSEAADKADH